MTNNQKTIQELPENNLELIKDVSKRIFIDHTLDVTTEPEITSWLDFRGDAIAEVGNFTIWNESQPDGYYDILFPKDYTVYYHCKMVGDTLKSIALPGNSWTSADSILIRKSLNDPQDDIPERRYAILRY